MNEMRYAGYHLLNSLSSSGQISNIDQLRRARAHAQRACYEAAEAGLVIALKEINLFNEKYRDAIVTNDVKDYIQILSASSKAKDRLGVKRKLGDEQDLDHQTHMELFEYLSNSADILRAARPELNKRIKDSKWGVWRWGITTFIAIVALIVAFFREKIWALIQPFL